MGQDFRDPEVAKKWENGGTIHNPLRAEQLEILVEIVRRTYREDHVILDLGYGTGQVDKLILEAVNHAKIVGIDWSDAMMEIAKNRLNDFGDHFESIRWDLSQLASLSLAHGSCQIVIAVQSLHHLTPEGMKSAYRWIFENLEHGGIFLLQDRVRVEDERVFPLYQRLWQKVDALNHTALAAHEGDNYEEHIRRTRERGDYPVLLDEHLKWLKDEGFHAACLHAYGHRVLVGAVKP